MKNLTNSPFYIFLDVDGVLNCKSDWKRPFSLNKSCILAFSELCKLIGKPVCILSSTWRAGLSKYISSEQVDNLLKKLSEEGISISDSTPVSSKSRQEEIAYYLKRHCDNTDRYLILDDDKSLFPNPDSINLYITDHLTGLTKKDLPKIRKMLKSVL